MGDHVTISAEIFQGTRGQGSLTTQHHIAIPIEEFSASQKASKDKRPVTDDNVQNPEECCEESQEDMRECRYCHEEDFVSKLETPCSCNGSLRYVHKNCIDQWYHSKGSMICEICKQRYHPNYTVPEPIYSSSDETEISEEWTFPGTNTQIQAPLLVVERATNGLIESMNKDFTLRNPSGGVIFGTALLIFMAVLVVKDAYNYAPPRDDKVGHTLYWNMSLSALFLTV
ncbi:uncharacterized protein LOC113862531 [Abrus precatorius]|uniref:Uncharacterized protein LOC113862531 n=1 Tax=Abrus precatorius TaxID=3816 RepID=A0A8B8L7T7_ABRPR|nr:uncharacterized protein LOC113862531 [Abrus precatorius]